MGFKMNLTNDEIKTAQSSFDPLEEGTYGAVIYDMKFGLSKSSNKPMFTAEFKVTEGMGGIGRKIRGYYTIDPERLWSVNQILAAAELPIIDKDTPAGEYEFPEPEEFVGKEVNITLGIRKFDGVNKKTGEAYTGTENTVKKVTVYKEDAITGNEADSGPKKNQFLS